MVSTSELHLSQSGGVGVKFFRTERLCAGLLRDRARTFTASKEPGRGRRRISLASMLEMLERYFRGQTHRVRAG